MSFIEVMQLCLSFLSLVITVVVALAGLALKSILKGVQDAIKNNTDDIDKNTKSIEKVASRQAERMDKLEDNLNDLKAELPHVYVLREDYVRTMNSVETRVMGVDNKLDRVLERIPREAI
jgi:septal ring factor EnvC (AmiA/AmiB activator)